MISFLNLKNLKTVNWRDHNMAGAQAVHVAHVARCGEAGSDANAVGPVRSRGTSPVSPHSAP